MEENKAILKVEKTAEELLAEIALLKEENAIKDCHLRLLAARIKTLETFIQSSQLNSKHLY
jgi:hypothetical protein